MKKLNKVGRRKRWERRKKPIRITALKKGNEKLSDREPIFDTFYKKACEKIIDTYKEKLNQ